jgi:hypothetical protein
MLPSPVVLDVIEVLVMIVWLIVPLAVQATASIVVAVVLLLPESN